MNKTSNPLTQMSIDLKKCRIRVHKESLHLIGDPKYIQLLVNVSSRQMAIRAVENEQADILAYRVDQNCMDPDSSFEIYSRPFIKKLCKEFEWFDKGRCYRLTGTVIEFEKIVIFPLDSLRKIDNI